jgi:hypothetical protein
VRRPRRCVLLVLVSRVFHLLAALLDILAESLHRVACGEAECKHHDAQYGDDLFHGFFLSG